MSFHELLAAIRVLSPAERAQLKRELESIEEEYVDHGVSAEQWKKIEETQRALAKGKMATRPAREVMAEIFEKYDNA